MIRGQRELWVLEFIKGQNLIEVENYPARQVFSPFFPLNFLKKCILYLGQLLFLFLTLLVQVDCLCEFKKDHKSHYFPYQ